jgi:hypothetical protein
LVIVRFPPSDRSNFRKKIKADTSQLIDLTQFGGRAAVAETIERVRIRRNDLHDQWRDDLMYVKTAGPEADILFFWQWMATDKLQSFPLGNLSAMASAIF